MAADWRDVVRRGAGTPAPAVAAPPSNPAIERLLAERRALEARMAALTGVDLDAARYPVPTMAERRADHRKWETARATRAAAVAERPVERRAAPVVAAEAPPAEPGTPVAPSRWYAARDAVLAGRRAAPPAPRAVTPRPAPPRVAPVARAARAAPVARERPAAHAAKVERVKPVRAVTPVRPVRAPQSARAERPAPPRPAPERKPAATPPRAAPRRPAVADRAPRAAAPAARPHKQVDEAPRNIAPRESFAPDLRRAVKSATERPAARSTARTAIGDGAKRVGAKRLDKPRATVERVVAKPRAALDRADRAGRGIADNWTARRDAIAGPDLKSYTRGYDARSARLLGVETGSLNDMAERTERQRQAAIGRRAEARRSEASDADRRARALDRRKNRDTA